jgi:hypothetical protein
VNGSFLLCAAGLWLEHLRRSLSTPLEFDDAYMFYRYALHVRQGLGMSWNLDGVHTFGETSQLWGVPVLLLTYLPLSASKALIVGSWVCSVGMIWTVSWAVSQNATSRYMRSAWRVASIVALPLMLTYMFRVNAVTGMETMLAAMLCAAFAGGVLAWSRGAARPEFVALLGLLLFLARPESAVVVMLMPALVGLYSLGGTKRGLSVLLGVFLASLALDLIACKAYYGTPFPLSLYMKSRHGYEGYAVSWHPFTGIMMLLASCWPFVALLVLLVRRQDWRMVAVLLLPAVAVFAYLTTVTQIMGKNSRYYLPYLGLIVIPALLVLDRRIADGRSAVGLLPSRRVKVLACCAVIAGMAVLYVNQRVIKMRQLSYAVDRMIERRNDIYDPEHFETTATVRLPVASGYEEFVALTKRVIQPLPIGTTIAASEVGYVGAMAPHVNVIDIAGLNDTEIALSGFDMNALLARHPDIIWMPHNAYTFQRGLMIANPKFLKDYDYFVGAASYGLALRRDSPIRPQIDREMQLFWADMYPGYKMSDYLAKAASWSGAKHAASSDDKITEEYEKDQLDYATQE